MLDLKSLKNAFSSISKIGKGEDTFLVGETKITIRLLLPKEETEVQKLSANSYSEEIKDNPDNGNVATARYLETFKLTVLSYAIIEVGELSLRGVEFVPTGEVLPNGKPVRITKFKAIRDLLLTFSRPILDNIFQRYNDLSTKTEIVTDQSLDYDPIDLTEEIKSLEERLEELKRKQYASNKFAEKKSESESEDVNAEEVETPVEQKHDNFEQTVEVQTPNNVQERVEPQQEVVQDNSLRQRVMPSQVSPPSEKQQVEEMPKAKVMEHLQSSFVDKDKDDPFPQSALANEHERLNQLRRQRTTPHRRPPHLQAKQTSEDIKSEVGQQVGDIGGVPVYRTGEVQEISNSKQAGNTQQNISIDSQPKSSNNPRFRR